MTCASSAADLHSRPDACIQNIFIRGIHLSPRNWRRLLPSRNRQMQTPTTHVDIPFRIHLRIRSVSSSDGISTDRQPRSGESNQCGKIKTLVLGEFLGSVDNPRTTRFRRDGRSGACRCSRWNGRYCGDSTDAECGLTACTAVR